MRIRVDIPDKHAQALARIAEREGVSVHDLIRESVAKRVSDAALRQAFGALKGKIEDGLEYQLKIRSEWDHRP